MIKLLKFWAIGLVVTGQTFIYGQSTFLYKAPLNKVDNSAYYKINIASTLLAKSKADLSDVRIYSSDGKEIPYLVVPSNHTIPTTKVEKLPIIEQKFGPDKLYYYTIHNNSNAVIDNLVLTVNNFSAKPTLQISGSNNSIDWFIIKEKALVEVSNIDQKLGLASVNLSFPATKFRFIKITLDNKKLLPFKIVETQTIIREFIKPQEPLLPINEYSYKLYDSSNRNTYVDLEFKEPQIINAIVFYLNNKSTHFYRNINLLSTQNQVQNTYPSHVSSGDSNWIFCQFTGKKFQLEIVNDNNPPLRLDSLHILYKPQYLIGFLEANTQYYLVTGNALVAFPEYDLKHFADSLLVTTNKVITHQKLESTSNSTFKIQKSANNHWLMWIGLIIAIVVLAWLSNNLIKETKNKQ